MNGDQNISGGFHVSGSANVSFTNAGVAAGQYSSATVGSSPEAVDEEALARRVLALVDRLRQSEDPAAVQTAEDLQYEVSSPSRRWDQVLRFLTRAGQGVAATTVLATEIQGLDEAVRALLP
ncbi:hypothetical protein [Streptomyces sp. FH025]|uniref:hypothetical protein n=1 Tax=Streptomyces sp. FH025 TaxID=2815937 RepID=UPI001A9F98F7|nr:hypothetical protein [Streptomyces sp. FH025]MBO1419084.1 hypothetical protein [Streptomyces sp. FH025]